MNDLGLGIIVSLKDAFTQNATRIQSSMQTLDASVESTSKNMTQNLGLIEKGTMMTGAGLALLAIPAGLVASTVATQRALGELASVGVKDFRAMEDAAEAFTNQWAGASKAEFIGAAYDVKSALANLSDTAVGTFAAMAALTGKATKATTQEMVETFTTAYGIFKPIMRDMSDMDWATMFSGALAETVGIFKTTGPQMADAIKNIGAIAAASNVPLQEQMAILGQLQTTMPGSEAGTLYKSFMLKVAEAGNELGLSFVDTQGKLKGIVPILQELKRGFPDLSNAAAQVKLKKAFGSDEAVRFLLQMSMGLDQLEGNIKSIEHAMKGGTAVTLEMARAMNMDIGSQYGLVRQQLQNLFEILGRTFLPVAIPIFFGISRIILYLQHLAKSAPGVTRVILTLTAALGLMLVVGGGIISIIGTIGILLPAVQAGFAALGPMIAGVGTAGSTFLWPVIAIIAAVVMAVIALKYAWETNFAGIRDAVLGAWNKISLVFRGIWALITSLRGGSAQMSAGLAGKLQSAGLLKFVVTVFQVYYRVREFLVGLWQAFSTAFGKIRAILEPAVKVLMGALGELGKAIGSILAAFGLATTSIDASSFKNFGKTLGSLLGIMVQVSAYTIKFIIYPLSWIIRIVAAVIKAVVWFGKIIVTAFTASAPYIYRFLLPIKMIVQALVMVGRVIYTVWQMITGDISVVDGLKSIGSAVLDFLMTPFVWVRDVASTTWRFLLSIFPSIVGGFRSAGNKLLSVFLDLPVVSTISRVFGIIRSLISGQIDLKEAGKQILITLGQGMLTVISIPGMMLSYVFGHMLNALGWVSNKAQAFGSGLIITISSSFLDIEQLIGSTWSCIRGSAISAWSIIRQTASGSFSYIISSASNLVSSAFQSGRAVMTTIASGIKSAASMPYEAARSALSKIRKLLPFSDAKEGPLSTLTRSGAALLEAFSSGISRASELPAKALTRSLASARSLMNVGIPASALAATLAITPAIAGPVRSIDAGKPDAVAMNRTRLLAVTRSAAVSGTDNNITSSSNNESLRPILEAILAKLGDLSDRPIDVSVTTKLDGRQIAQSVYKDMKERKVKNYETM